MSLQKKPYEISIWEDVIVYVGKDSNGEDIESQNISDLTTISYQYYTERQLAVIGSSTMTSPARTINNVLKQNINGVETLTFDMYYQYEDIDEGQLVHNPLIDYVVDERKVKLHYEDKWYDFIVKKDDEKGREYKYSYTCKGLAANELGKTGFRVELDKELENNMGTVQQLGAAILEDSDWQLASSGQQEIQQTNDEALYLIKLNSNIIGIVRSSDPQVTKEIASGSYIYVYYSTYANQVENFFQFIYVDKSNGLGIPNLYEDKITIYCNNTAGGTYDLYMNGVTWVDGVPNFEDTNTQKVVGDYRGRRYVRKQLTGYDPILEQPILKYKGATSAAGIVADKEYYGYTSTEYLDVNSVTNYVYNSTDFRGTSYWTGYNSTSLDARVYPDVTPAPIDPNSEIYSAYLIVKFDSDVGRAVNEGIVQNYSRIDRFEKGEKYRFKIWVGTLSNDEVVSGTIPFRCVVKKYTLIDADDPSDKIYFDFNSAGTSAGDGYYIVDAECARSATWRDLNSSVGIFLYPRTNNNLNIDYYIKDIQLYRYILKENGEVMNIDDVPEARVITSHHFYDPVINAGFTSEEDYIFSDTNEEYYIPQYGSGANEFEKVRSITAKESNRFNLLQELCETFECWVKFEIAHESNGQISIENYTYYNPVEIDESEWEENKYYVYNQNTKEYELSTKYNEKKKYFLPENRKRQSKKVVFYGEILQDNYVGFKYGINLKDNNRTLDSEQIVTKIIVKDNVSEVAKNGFCSIARAQDNPLKETFALNFDYYTSQGLINSSILNNDLYLELNGSIGLYPKISRLNNGYIDSEGVSHPGRNQLIDSQAELATAIDNDNAIYQTQKLRYDEATKQLSELLDPVSGTIVQYTGYQYDDFVNQYNREKDDNGYIEAYEEEVYYIKEDLTSAPIPDDGTISYYIVTQDVEPSSEKSYFILDNNHFESVGNITKFFANTVYYELLSESKFIAGTFFQTGEDTTKLKLIGNDNSEVYIYAAARRITQLNQNDYVNDNYTIQKLTEVVTQTKNKNEAYEEMTRAKTARDTAQANYDSIKEQLANIAKATGEIEKEFNTKYSRFIQEGSWTDDNYLDDDLYYLDALDVLYQSAYPKVTYNFKTLELSQLEGYEAYKFEIGHKTFVEDIEFFGYKYINNIRTPVRETVVVTESTLNLDEPDKNDLKVQNYRAHFEDLFQRITAATQNLEYHSGEYGRAAQAVSPDGAIEEAALQKSFATAAYIIQNSRDQSVVWDDTGIQATNLSDPAQVTRLASGGLLVSSDGGQTWGVAISGYGINANYLNVGTIDADKINILSGSYPTFRWDALGLRAYSFQTDNGTMRSYDPTKYVAHDRFGIYGISGYLVPPTLDSVEDVEEKANFALTWNGLFMKSTHRDGYIRISPTEDIVLKEYNSVAGQPDKTRAIFGCLNKNDANGDEIYGLALYDGSGNATVTTQSDGTLWLKDAMRIGTNNQTNTIYIGVGDADTTPGVNRYKVIKVDDTSNNENFVVYSDGVLKATAANITGIINATGGHIGNMNIAELVNTVGVRINPNSTEFKYNGSIATPSSNTFTITHAFDGVITYRWYKGADPTNLSLISGANQSNYIYTFDSSDFQNGIMYLKGEVESNGVRYSDRITLSYVMDGVPGDDADAYTIRTNVEEVLKFIANGSTFNNRTYDFSIKYLQMYVFNLKEQTSVNRYNSSTPETPNAVLRISISGYNLDEIIDPTKYSTYIKTITENETEDDYISYYFDLLTLYNKLLDNSLINDLAGNDSDEKAAIISALQSFFSESLNSTDIVIYGTVTDTLDKQHYIEKYISLKPGLSDEMMKFSINAGGWNSVMGQTGLEFNANGFNITNGAFEIYTKRNDVSTLVFKIDPNTNQLYMNGTGTFNGNGTFNGTITANAGNIGGFTITENTIEADGLKLKSASGGNSSSVNVQNINIGSGAHIDKYLNIGNLSLLSPSQGTMDGGSWTNRDDSAIKLSLPRITEDTAPQNGKAYYIKVDNDYIPFTGNNFELGTDYYEDNIYFQLKNNGDIVGNNWYIKKGEDNIVEANFGKLIAQSGDFTGTINALSGTFRGTVKAGVIDAAIINAATFVTQNTRAMGGAFIFKPTFNIAKNGITPVDNENDPPSDLVFTLEGAVDYFQLDDSNDKEYIVSISGEKDTIYANVIGVNQQDKNKITIRARVNDYSSLLNGNYQTVTFLGQSNSDLIIGINSDDSSNILPGRSLSMQTFSTLQGTDKGYVNYNSGQLILGDLSVLNKNNISGYGLYAENVYLYGSLTTVGTNNNDYAGINTNNSIVFNYDNWNTGEPSSAIQTKYTNNKIIFWGGASSNSTENIQTAPFIVTDKGNVFARNGEFKGSVISNSIITHTIIKAPIIYGSDDSSNTPSLKIYDTHTDRGGISFYKKVGEIDQENILNDTKDEETLNISIKGFIHRNNSFISFDDTNNYILYNGTQYQTGTTTFKEDEISRKNDDESIGSKIGLNQNNSLTLSYNSAHGIIIKDEGIENFGGLVENEGSMSIFTQSQGERTQELSYKVQNGYYCLYVRD